MCSSDLFPSSFLLLLFFSGQPSSDQHDLRRAQPRLTSPAPEPPQPSPRSDQATRSSPTASQSGDEANPGWGDPTQARSGQPRPVSSDPPHGQLVCELSRARQPRFVDGFLICTHQLVAAVVVVTHELSEVDSEVRSSRNGLSKILA